MRSSLCTNVNRRESSSGISTRLIRTNPNLFNLSSNTIKQASAGSAMMNATSRPAEMNLITHTLDRLLSISSRVQPAPQRLRPQQALQGKEIQGLWGAEEDEDGDPDLRVLLQRPGQRGRARGGRRLLVQQTPVLQREEEAATDRPLRDAPGCKPHQQR
ncbi:hypothetical protein B0T26DRAFT_748846 [Lasiosphaeria miniovina]|uniref:Uncharacterized protein n=1 Tax=Lasiosphaeria miniovina TaxID=1954250 RepID=A0AA40B6N3_9PEZI|nr:uncharacterized protein B0T26DRAFT_748846 [Lasiosphaeria miniovina]KAK0728666.1 hypothetical protein B0T26DRAFT_748846 [Lasiosphaeria miniovina]